jgi:ribosome biogenesis GTPase / thiamine phosphate phosphatase
VGVDRGHVDVLWEGQVVTARYAGSMRRTRVVVGDRVRIRPPRHDTDVARVLERMDRDTILQRTGDDVDADERVLVANADQVAVVLAADRLEPALGFVDRVQIAGAVGGLATLIVVNRCDLVEDRDDLDRLLDRYRALDIPVVWTSAVEGTASRYCRTPAGGVDRLHGPLGRGQDVPVQRAGARRQPCGGGDRPSWRTSHDRRQSRHALPDGTGWLVDTPGVRSFGLGALDPIDLSRHLPELADLDCALDDCLHDGEPGCRIDEADIHPARLASYWRLLGAVRGDHPWDLEDDPLDAGDGRVTDRTDTLRWRTPPMVGPRPCWPTTWPCLATTPTWSRRPPRTRWPWCGAGRTESTRPAGSAGCPAWPAMRWSTWPWSHASWPTVGATCLGPTATPTPPRCVPVQSSGSGALADRLYVSALIELRSHERFLLLAAADHPLSGLYADLEASEAGHHRLFVQMAELAGGTEDRWSWWLDVEAEVAAAQEPGPRMHSGPPYAAG